ncbi:MAG TPA: hypothetical protein VMZ69_11455 [Saprospiraceae bacterium]|nr:hypothetical protein [Saprospiraceae bacterium]
MNSSRFLFYLYYYPPLPGTAPKRNHQISSEISKRVSFSQIFTSAIIKNEVVQQPDDAVITIKALDYRKILRKRSKNGALPEEQKEGKKMQWLIKLINTFPVNILAGEGGIFYFMSLLRRGQRSIRDNKITHLYSSYRPFTDHYAAFILKRRNPHLFWIADFRDLIIDPHYGHLFYPENHHFFFKRIFGKANLLTTVSDGLAMHLKKYNPEVITLRNGIEHIPEQIQPVHCKYFKISYTGSMFLDKRNPEPVFIALQELFAQNLIKRDDVRIIYAGKDSFYWNNMASKYEMDSIFDDKGIILHDEALAIQKNACVNLLLTVSSDKLQGVLTGKMIEYFEAGSPILGVVVNQNDPELDSMLIELEIGKSFADREIDYDNIRAFLYDEYLYWKRMGTNRKPVRLDVLRDKYSVEATMRPLYNKVFS